MAAASDFNTLYTNENYMHDNHVFGAKKLPCRKQFLMICKYEKLNDVDSVREFGNFKF